jgi:hypothetical protein
MKSAITCALPDSRCADLEFAADNPSICPGYPSITGLRVDPPSGQVEIGSKCPFRAFLTFSDGREKDVTDKADWSSSNDGLATVAVGVCTGVQAGLVIIDASYRSLFDFAQLTVIAQCFQVGMDIVLAFDRSASMSTKGADGSTRLDNAKAAAAALVENCIFTKDQVCVISFAGIYQTTADGVTTKLADATEHIVLSPSKADILAAIQSVALSEPCLYDLPDGGRGNRCATGLGGGLQKAKDELLSSRSRSGVKKVVVLLTDGVENICTPDPIVLAAEMKGFNWIIVVVALSVPDDPIVVCAGAPTTAWAYLRQMAACNLFFSVSDAGAMTNLYANIPSTLCQQQGDPCFYYFAPPTGNPPDPGHMRDAYDYVGFVNWDVVSGFVDLIGIDLWPTLQPGSGLFVDLVGTNLEHVGLNTSGTIQSKQSFSFSQNRYRLSMKLAGNLREPGTSDKVAISIGSVLPNRVVVITNWQQPFTTYNFDFSPSAAGSGKISIQGVHLGKVLTVGPLLDSVKLENLDSGEVYLNDDFDSENPI